MGPKGIVAPSLLSGDFAQLDRECSRMIEYGAGWLHLDVMDGHFVPNLTIGPPVIKSIRKHTDAFLDCHLMVSNPEKWVSDFAKAGATQITFHFEATTDPLHMIRLIKGHGMRAGIAIKPKTPVDSIFPFLNDLDMILIMTVEPGFGGQKIIMECLEKVKILREKLPNLDIQVDGGINMENLKDCLLAGANIIVAGSLIFENPSPQKIISDMNSAIKKYFP